VQGRCHVVDWTGVDICTIILPEVVPEIGANPMSFMCRGMGDRPGRSRTLISKCRLRICQQVTVVQDSLNKILYTWQYSYVGHIHIASVSNGQWTACVIT